MASPLSRRDFIRTTTLAGAGLLAAEAARAAPRLSPNEKLNIGIIGVANRAAENLRGVAHHNIVALCDVDDNYLAAAAKQYPQAKTYHDFRQLIDAKGLDAVVISTPDHLHAPAALRALRADLHVYCEKPLGHTVHECRLMADEAKKRKRVTQMGTQIHSTDNYRRVVELVQSGAIGPVKEVHVWVDRVWAGRGLPVDTPPVPASLHWDLWLGPAPERPYNPAYVPGHWRGWWDFGGGTLADMACHHVDLPTWALKLRHASTVQAEGPEVNPQTAPAWLKVKYAYPAREGMPAVDLTWYHGGKRPPHFEEGKLPRWGDGTLFIGEKGMLLADYGRHVLLPEADFKDFVRPSQTIPNSIGHYEEWLQAIKTGGPTTCNFDYSGALAENVLLGNVAYRSGQKLEWDARRLRVKNSREANALVRKQPRKGWEYERM